MKNEKKTLKNPTKKDFLDTLKFIHFFLWLKNFEKQKLECLNRNASTY